MEDVLGLLDVALSGSKDDRTTATRHLEEALALNPAEYAVYLLQAGCSPQLPAERSLSALIYVKNFMLHTMNSASFRDTPALDTVKSLILSGLGTVPSKHRRILLELVRTVVSEFGWNYFPSVLPLVEAGSCLGDPAQSIALLESVYVLAKRFKTMNLEPMEKKMQVSIFLCEHLPKFLGLGDMECLKVVFKLFECAAETFAQQTGAAGSQLPISEELLQSWLSHLVQFPLQTYAAAAAAGGAVYTSYVKCVKRIGSMSFSLVHDAIKKSKASAFAKYFLNTFGSPFTQLWIQWLGHCVAHTDRSIHRKSELFAIRYIKMAVCHERLYNTDIKSNAMQIIEKQLFPYLCYDENDREKFEDDDLQEYSRYILEEHNPAGEYSQRQAASNCILAMISGKQAHLDAQGMYALLSILNTGLSRDDTDEATASQTFGFLHLLAILRKSLKAIPDIWQHQMETVLVTHIAKRLSSPFVYIRCKAIYVCQRYARIPIASEDNFRNFIGAITVLIADTDPRVRLSSIDAMCQFLGMKRASPYLSHILVPMVNECIHFNEVVQTMFVPTALRYLSDHFAAELTPVLDKLTASLARNFLAAAFNMRQQEETMGEDDDTRNYEHEGIAAMSSLQAINSLVLSTEFNRPALASMRPDIIRVIKAVLDQADSFDFMDSVLEILTHVTYCTSPITQDLWDLFPVVAKCVLSSGVGVDYFGKIEGVLDNYISNGAREFFSNHEAVNLIYQMCEKMLIGGVEACDEDVNAAPQLMEAAFHQAKHQCPELFSPHLRPFVVLLLQGLANPEVQKRGVKVSMWLICAFMDAFYFDASAVLVVLNETQAFDQFFQGYFDFFGAIFTPDLAPKKGGKKSKNALIQRQLEAVEILTVLHRKVNILGLTSFLLVATNPSGPFAAHISPDIVRNVVRLLSFFITENEKAYSVRSKKFEEDIALVKAGYEPELDDEDDEDMDVEMEDDEDGGDLTNGANDLGDDDDEDGALNDGGDEAEETDDYRSPIDDVSEVGYYLSWHQAAALGLNPLFVQAASGVALPEQALQTAQQTCTRYMQLKKEMDAALEEDHLKRADVQK